MALSNLDYLSNRGGITCVSYYNPHPPDILDYTRNPLGIHQPRQPLSFGGSPEGCSSGDVRAVGGGYWVALVRAREIFVSFKVPLDRLARGLVRLTIVITHVEADKSAG